MAEFYNTFKGKKIFLTGHTGFKGSWMSVWLSLMGASVKGYALNPEKISLYNQIKDKLKNHRSVIGDIRDKKKLEKEILSFQPDFIFHLAAQPLVLESYKNPVETFEVNAIGTANLLDAIRNLRKKCVVVIVTTDKVYQNIEADYPYRESDKLGGYDPYSASKAAAEIIIESYRLSFYNPANFSKHKKVIASARAGNVIGGGDYAENRLMPDIYRSLSKSKKIKIRNPKAVRPWQHVLESLRGYLMLAAAMKKEPKKYSSSFNFGPVLNDVLTVEEVVRQAIKCWGTGKYSLVKSESAPHEAGLLKLNIHKAKQELGWQPIWNSKSVIEKTMQWYKNSIQKKSDMFNLCVKEIYDLVSHK